MLAVFLAAVTTNLGDRHGLLVTEVEESFEQSDHLLGLLSIGWCEEGEALMCESD
jgi:hypothetical protein